MEGVVASTGSRLRHQASVNRAGVASDSGHHRTHGYNLSIVSTVTVSDRARLSGWRRYVRELWERREFAWFLSMGNLEARNASTTLGLMWWVVNPLLMSAVYFFVFGVIFPGTREGEPAFLAWLISGMFVFTYTSTAMTSGANSILSNSPLLVNVRFPRLILPISAIIEAGVGFAVSLPVFFLLAWPVNGVAPSWSLVWLPLAFVLHTLFNVGLAAMTARLAVPFRDINNFIPHFNRLWMYLSPIIWPLAFIQDKAEWMQTLVGLNPLYRYLAIYRGALMGRAVELSDVLIAGAWTIGVVGLGILLFVRYEGNMVRHL